jgi:Tol biopolymer transport system component
MFIVTMFVDMSRPAGPAHGLLTGRAYTRAAMDRRRSVLVFTLVLAGALLTIASSGAEPRGSLARNGLIAFSDFRPDFDLFLFDLETRRATRLTHGVADDLDPALSPDQRRVAFVRGEARTDLMIVDVSDKRVRRVLRTGFEIAQPTWSPDGSKIAWVSPNPPSLGVHVINADGTGERRLTQGADQDPAWSPDGSKIAVARGGGIWAADAIGSMPERELVPPSYVFLREPAWSPDGARLAMRTESTSLKSGNSVLVADADGSSLRAIPLRRGYRSDIAWTRDGRVRFSVQREPYSDIYAVAEDGSGLRRIARIAALSRCRGPVARVEGSTGNDEQLVYSAGVGCQTIYGIRRNGSGLKRLTVGPATEPAFSVDGRRLAFLDASHSRIYVLRSGNARPREVARMPRGSIYPAASWSPDGSKLVFRAGQAIWILDVRNKQLRRLPGTGSRDGTPDWGPDGRIAFARGHGETADIWITSPRGRFMRRVKRNAVAPDWSPDGRRLAYQKIVFDPGDEYDLGVVDVATRRARRLTKTPNGFEGSPRWSPDGRWIAFGRGSEQQGRSGIFVITPRGTAEKLIYPASPNFAGSISWQALPR